MQESQFTESQIVAVLKEGEAGIPVAEIARKHGISRNAYFSWKARRWAQTRPREANRSLGDGPGQGGRVGARKEIPMNSYP